LVRIDKNATEKILESKQMEEKNDVVLTEITARYRK
jgi:hypothetical protein